MIRSIFYLVILVLDILAIIDCAKTNMDSGKKVVWILVILIFPVLGPILYYLVGRS